HTNIVRVSGLVTWHQPTEGYSFQEISLLTKPLQLKLWRAAEGKIKRLLQRGFSSASALKRVMI
ncbi:MAG: hypothetical protein AAFW75_25480, partial [Cyanobacteria bacterium J06636_16]